MLALAYRKLDFNDTDFDEDGDIEGAAAEFEDGDIPLHANRKKSPKQLAH